MLWLAALPETLGRWKACPRYSAVKPVTSFAALGVCYTLTGKPVLAVLIPLISQPPSTASSAGCRLVEELVTFAEGKQIRCLVSSEFASRKRINRRALVLEQKFPPPFPKGRPSVSTPPFSRPA